MFWPSQSATPLSLPQSSGRGSIGPCSQQIKTAGQTPVDDYGHGQPRITEPDFRNWASLAGGVLIFGPEVESGTPKVATTWVWV